MQHYYSTKQTSDIVLKKLDVNLRGINLHIVTSSGVFSKKAIDKGTELLINSMIIKPGWDILDMGCGYGIIGLIAAKLSKSIPYLVDSNERACKIAKINAKTNNIKAEILQGDMYKPVEDKKFDTILINPPQTAGKDICFAMIDGAINHLKREGLLQLVARPNKGGKSLAARMKEVFGNVEIMARKSGYVVYVSKHL